MYIATPFRGYGQEEDEILKPPSEGEPLKDEVTGEDVLQSEITEGGEVTNGGAAPTIETAEKAGFPWTWVVLGIGVLAVGYFVFKKD